MADMKTEILYEDNAILVVYKPPGLATQTAGVAQPDVVSELTNYLRKTAEKTGKTQSSAIYLGVIHRLDQPVEGLLVFTKNRKAAAVLSAQLQKTEEGAGFCKHYYAVLCGRPVEERGRLENFLCKRDGMAVVLEEQAGGPGSPASYGGVQERMISGSISGEEGKTLKQQGKFVFREAGAERRGADKPRRACLQYCILQMRSQEEGLMSPSLLSDKPTVNGADIKPPGRQERNGADFESPDKLMRNEEGFKSIPDSAAVGSFITPEIALADIQIETGRFHQIRAQMAHAGMPLLGDVKYGSEASRRLSRELGIRSVALCAYRLEFAHPVSGRRMDFQVKPRGRAFSFFSQL